MPRYRSKPKAPASGEESGMALDAPSANVEPANPGFGRVPSSPGERNALTRKGPGRFKSSHPHNIPPTWVRGNMPKAPKLEEEI
jgi:hypothetical protein